MGLDTARAFTDVVKFLCIPHVTHYQVEGGFSETLAYVYNNEPIIYVFGNYFEKDDEGENSRQGILVHELTHLAFVATTNGLPDSKEVYDKAEALELAANSSDDAQNNAQNYSLFYEDALFGIFDN